MQRLTEDQLARLETLATERRGRPAKGRRFAVGLRREQARRTHDDQGLIG